VIFLLVADALYLQAKDNKRYDCSEARESTTAQRHIGHIHLVTSWRTCDTRHRPHVTGTESLREPGLSHYVEVSCHIWHETSVRSVFIHICRRTRTN